MCWKEVQDFLILYVLQRSDTVQFWSLRQEARWATSPPHLQTLEAIVAGWQLISKLDPEGSHFKD